MSYIINSHGKIFQSGIGGTYPVNDSDPQNDVDEAPGDDTPEPEQEPPTQDEIESRNERNPEYLDKRKNHF